MVTIASGSTARTNSSPLSSRLRLTVAAFGRIRNVRATRPLASTISPGRSVRYTPQGASTPSTSQSPR